MCKEVTNEGGKRSKLCSRNEGKQLLREPEILDRLVKQLMDKGMDKIKHMLSHKTMQKRGV